MLSLVIIQFCKARSLLSSMFMLRTLCAGMSMLAWGLRLRLSLSESFLLFIFFLLQTYYVLFTPKKNLLCMVFHTLYFGQSFFFFFFLYQNWSKLEGLYKYV